MKKSLWIDGVKLNEFNALDKDIKTDVLIIGGGLCGLLCAHFLQQCGVDYVLVEADKIARGTTENTTAKITVQHGIIYKKIIDSYGFERAKMYLDANCKALAEYERLCGNINCDFEKKDAYTYSLTNRDKLEKEVEAVNSLGLKCDYVKNTELPFKNEGAIRLENQAQFNPLKFIGGFAQGLNVYEKTFVKEFAPHKAVTEKGFEIRAEKIIVTTHFPFINNHGGYFLKLYQHRSYVSAFSGMTKLKGMYVDEDEKGMSFRSYGDYILVVGGGHRTGKQSDGWYGIEKLVENIYPDAMVKYRWAAQDCMSLDGIPYIGKYSKSTPDMYVATGFNKWGMTSSMVSAMILTDMVQGKKNDFEEVFSPRRSMLKPQLFINGFEATVNLLTPSTRRCPHLGCALKWNKAEHTWDCPCHGSRFEENGELINGPSTGSAKVNKKYH